jgi:hypothetical protein
VADFYTGAYGNRIPILDDLPAARDMLYPPGMGRGLVPRDYAVDPPEMFAPPDQMQLIPESEWDARFDEQEATQSSLEHLYLSGPGGTPIFEHLDQNGFPDCWAYSTGHAMMLERLRRGSKVIRLNPTGVATMLRQINGGWCGLSAKFARDHGFPEEGTGPGQWPRLSRRGKDTPELRAAMLLNRVTEDWTDLTRAVHSQNLTEAQSATCSFNNIPGPEDFNHWAHSVCRIRHVRIERGSYGKLILNSWAGWGRYGLGVLRGSKMPCDGALAVRATT